MRILLITAGAANMYCGSCLRDNALASALIASGHDVTLVPLYTPTLTDEVNVSAGRVFFGGISVYLEQHSALFRHTPWLLDKIWDSGLALKLASRRSIPVNPKLLGELTVSMLQGEHGRQRKEFLKLVRWLETQPRPDIVNLPYTLLISLAKPLREALDAPVCCTLQGEDLFLDGLAEPCRAQAFDLIRSGIEHVDAFLAVSEYYAEYMARYLGIPPAKIHVTPLGINLEGYTPRTPDPAAPFTIGYFARVCPEKGLHLLCEAYRMLRQRHGLPASRLKAAGYLAPEHCGYLAAIERQMQDWGFGGEFRYHGVLDREQKIRFLQSLDVLSVPSIYAEPKGIYLLEAMAAGVPVVQPARGAFPEILRKTQGGILVEPGDCGSLAEGLLSLRRDPSRAAQIGRKGAQGVREHYNVAAMARRTLEIYDQLVRAPRPLAAEMA